MANKLANVEEAVTMSSIVFLFIKENDDELMVVVLA